MQSNLLLLRVSRSRASNKTLLLVASTRVRVEELNKKVQLLTRLVKENGGEFHTKKKKKKPKLEEEQTEKKKPVLNLMAKEDLDDYVEISHSFQMVCKSPMKISIQNSPFRLFRNTVNSFNISAMLQDPSAKHPLPIQLYSFQSLLMLSMN